ncbi:TRAM domain-containing protein [Paenibacillus sp. P26]|nr:TRAM domain-containing protein [Paenibacillus sp. P26]
MSQTSSKRSGKRRSPGRSSSGRRPDGGSQRTAGREERRIHRRYRRYRPRRRRGRPGERLYPFVQGALPGEKARVKVLKVKKQYGYAKLLEIVEASPDRVAAPCPIYQQCGGCQLQHMSYDAQLRWKRQLVVDSLERIGKLKVREAAEIGPVTGWPGATVWFR